MASILPFPGRGYSSSITLGKTPGGQPIRVTQDELCSGCYILGVQRSGKSSLLEHIIYQQMEQDECIIVFDPKGGDLTRNIIARMPTHKLSKTYLLDLTDKEYPVSFNPFVCRDVNSEEKRRATKNSVMRAFAKLWPEVERGQYFDEVLYPLVETFIECPELTMAHTNNFLMDDTFRNRYVGKLRSLDTKSYWQKEYNELPKGDQQKRRDPLIGRVRKLLRDEVIKRILCQRESRINFRKAIEKKEIVLINLPVDVPGYEYAAPVVGTFLLSAIYEATFSFADTPEDDRPGFTLIVDEFDNFATSDYERFFGKGRAFGVRQFLAHQYRTQLDRGIGTTTRDATLTAHTVVSFKTNPKDAREVADKFKGLKRRPTDICIDVLDRLKTHSNPLVKEFYWHFVIRIQEAAKMKTGTEEDWRGRKKDVLPEYDFGFGVVSFNPESATTVLTKLNELLYYAQKEMVIDEARKRAFIKAYGELNGIRGTTTLSGGGLVN